MQPLSEQILQNTRDILKTEGVQQSVNSGDTLASQVLPAMASTRDIQSAFYSFAPPKVKSPISAGKNAVLRRMKNIVINIMERTVMRQQKYNELTYQAILELKAQIDELKRDAPRN